MRLLHVVTEAQRLLAGDKANGPGWTGPEHVMGYSLRRVGEYRLELCDWDDEAIWQYSVEAALRITAKGDQALFDAAWDALRGVVAPSRSAEDQYYSSLPPLTAETWPSYRMWVALSIAASREIDLREWLMQPERQIHDVLGAFDMVVLKLRSLQ